MSRERLTLRNLGDLDNGRAGLAVNSDIAQMMADLDNRGDDEKVRKVVITIEAKKVTEGKSDIAIRVTSKPILPTKHTGITIAELVLNGRAAEAHFRPDSPSRPDQPGMFDQARGAADEDVE